MGLIIVPVVIFSVAALFLLYLKADDHFLYIRKNSPGKFDQLNSLTELTTNYKIVWLEFPMEILLPIFFRDKKIRIKSIEIVALERRIKFLCGLFWLDLVAIFFSVWLT